MSTPPFSSTENFRNAFESGLKSLLHEYDELGVYILVLANATFDRLIWDQLAMPLERKFAQLVVDYKKRNLSPLMLDPDDSKDDLEVFRQLLAIRFDQLSTTELRHCGHWELQFNQLRSFRPPRMSGKKIEGISAPFDQDGFHFNKPFLRKEIFWRGWLSGRNSVLLYNKFPFVELHGILVPEPKERRSQLLQRDDNEYLWRVTETLAKTLPGMGFGYNSYGAFASVNHLHFQMFIRENPLPISRQEWKHNGGVEPYPAACHCFDNADSTWRYISKLHESQIPYNLIYLPGKVYCLPRLSQGEYPNPDWTRGFAWYEMAGGFTTFSRDNYRNLNGGTLQQELAAVSVK